MKKCCETCKYFFEDGSVGVTDCTNEVIEEDDIEKYYTNGEEGCPCWVAKYSERNLRPRWHTLKVSSKLLLLKTYSSMLKATLTQ